MDEETGAKGPTNTAREIQRIKKAVITAADKRQRLPQPLFWSLFHNALKDVRRSKERERALAELLER
ncbi:MAG: hypothetical protein J5J00_10875 [Deltaproteobacteria bacterium]|nr:hypothetical protein [Deltaproteobacteria bacterium]